MVALALVGLALAGGCASGGDGGDGRPGNPAVYARIEALTDCGELQREFDTAMDTYDRRKEAHSLAYAEAAQARIKRLGCP